MGSFKDPDEFIAAVQRFRPDIAIIYLAGPRSRSSMLAARASAGTRVVAIIPADSTPVDLPSGTVSVAVSALRDLLVTILKRRDAQHRNCLGARACA